MSQANIPILMYHSIELMPKSTTMRSLHVTPRRFKFQMWLLKILGYQGLSMKMLKPYLDGEKHGKVVGITFDDGYKNNLLNAAPILKKFGFSATCYIVSNNIGKSNIWDLEKKITQRPLMTKNEIFEWINLGMDIGAHSMTHIDLTSISNSDTLKEVRSCKLDLEEMFQLRISDFCYPYGKFNDSVHSIVKSAGYQSATTMIRGRANSGSEKLLLPRIPVNYRTLPYLFILKILTKYEDRR
jgi:peptidoglycan/xylan/chitin deacetylase (PgdA/CDA1 family)